MPLNRREALQAFAAGAATLGLRGYPHQDKLQGAFADYVSSQPAPRVEFSVHHTVLGPEVRLASGQLLCVEGLVHGRWVTKYWSATGMAAPGSSWPPAEAFDLAIQDSPAPGEHLNSGWQWVAAREVPGAKAGARVFAVELENPARALRLRLLTLLDGTPVLARWLEITNLGHHAIALTGLAPWAGRLWEGDAGQSVRLAHATRWRPQWAGWLEWSALPPGKTVLEQTHGLTYAKPYFLLHHTRRNEYVFAQLGWPVNYRMQFERGAAGVTFSLGPLAYHALRVLAPGETVTTPAVHLAYVQGDFDAAVQAMHEHVRRSVAPPLNPQRAYRSQYLLPGDQPLTVYRGAEYNETNVKKCVDVAAAAGLEVFIVDGPTWCATYGDWLKPNPRRFPHGLAPIRKYAHEKGLLFGLYFELEGGRPGYCSAGHSIGKGTCIANWTHSRLYQRHPQWFTQARDVGDVPAAWRPTCGACTVNNYVLNLAIPAAAEYFNRILGQVIDFYRLDLYRHDFNAPLLGDGPSTRREGFLECDYWRHYEALYDAFHRARQRHPELILQQASAGGTRLDLATAGAFNESYVTDVARTPSGYQMLDGVSVCLPPEMLVFPNGMSGPRQPDYETELRAAYAMGNTPMLFNAMLPKSLEDLTASRKRRLLHYAGLYKRFIRPLLATCRVYHHAPVSGTGGVESGDWLALEFMAPDRRHGWAIFIQLNPAGAATYHFIPRGLDSALTYSVVRDNTGQRRRMRGSQLAREGLTVAIAPAARSELVLFSAV